MPRSKYNSVSTKGLTDDPEVRKMCTAMRSIYRTHVQDVLENEYENDITPKEYIEIVGANCYYCGTPPSNMTKDPRYKAIAYNGIDRVNNNLGYVHGNIVTCCKHCNSAKSNMSESEFLKHNKQIYDYQSSMTEDEKESRIKAREQALLERKPKENKPEPKRQPTMFEAFGVDNT